MMISVFIFRILLVPSSVSIYASYSLLVIAAVFIAGCDNKVELGEAPKTEIVSDYTETHRPQYHFSPAANWMNDPNGMVYYEGEYHLFYQYYPDSTVWGPMHWGHAVSSDLVSWEHLPIALFPDELGYIFSGSAVIDWNNTSGLGVDGNPPMIAIFTHHLMAGEKEEGNVKFQYQSIAFSNDKGRTWTKYKGNPVIENPGIRDFRDPKVSWIGDQWVMVFAAGDHIQFYASQNLIDWEHLSDWGLGHGAQGRPWECPDFFTLEVPGTDEVKYVLIVSIGKDASNGGSGTQYFIGDWDGKTFTNDNKAEEVLWLDFGKDNYAGVTWADVPDEDGRRLFMGWMSNWQYAQVVPTELWRSAMTLPRELKLENTNLGPRLINMPVEELGKLEKSREGVETKVYTENTVIYQSEDEHLLKLELEFELPQKGMVEVRFSNSHDESLSVGYNVSEKTYFVDRSFAGDDGFSKEFADYHVADAAYEKENIKLLLYLDHSSIEMFADGGKCVMTEIFFPTAPFDKVELITEANDVKLQKGAISVLKGIW